MDSVLNNLGHNYHVFNMYRTEKGFVIFSEEKCELHLFSKYLKVMKVKENLPGFKKIQ